MVERRKKLRGTTAQLDAAVGLEGLLVYDRTRSDLRVFDGVLLGGFRIPNWPAIAAAFVPIGRTISTSGGLTGGGNLSANRTLGIDSTIARSATTVTAGDGLLGGGTLGANFSLSVATDVVRTSRQILPGDGLSGGGDLSANRTLAVDGTVVRTARQILPGSGLSGGGDLSADRTLTVDSTIARVAAVPPNARTITAGDGLTGGGDLSANRTLAVDTSVVRTTRNLVAGNGLSGGGVLSADRTFTLGTPGTTTLASTNSVSTTSHTHALDVVGLDARYALKAQSITAGTGLAGGGTLAATRTLTLDLTYTDARYANATQSIVAGNGLTGGGTLAASRTITLGTPGTLGSESTNSVTATSHTHSLDMARIAQTVGLRQYMTGVGESYQYVFAKPASGTPSINTNDIVNGADLVISDSGGSSGASLSGQIFKCLGRSRAGAATLFISAS